MTPISHTSAVTRVLVILGIFGISAILPAAQSTVRKGIVILVQFPDVKHSVTRDFALGRFNQGLSSYNS